MVLFGSRLANFEQKMNIFTIKAEEAGDYCGEWGVIIDEHGQRLGVRLFFFFDYLPDHPITRAKNCSRYEDQLMVRFKDDRLPDVDQMPFLPVTRNSCPGIGDIFQLAGYDD